MFAASGLLPGSSYALKGVLNCLCGRGAAITISRPAFASVAPENASPDEYFDAAETFLHLLRLSAVGSDVLASEFSFQTTTVYEGIVEIQSVVNAALLREGPNDISTAILRANISDFAAEYVQEILRFDSSPGRVLFVQLGRARPLLPLDLSSAAVLPGQQKVFRLTAAIVSSGDLGHYWAIDFSGPTPTIYNDARVAPATPEELEDCSRRCVYLLYSAGPPPTRSEMRVLRKRERRQQQSQEEHEDELLRRRSSEQGRAVDQSTAVGVALRSFWLSSAAAPRKGWQHTAPITEAPLIEYCEKVKDAEPFGCALCGKKCVFNGHAMSIIDDVNLPLLENCPPPLSARGVQRGDGRYVDVFAALVGQDGGFTACNACKDAVRKENPRREWSTDYGVLPKGLLELTPVEKCAIAKCRFYGEIVQVTATGTTQGLTHLKGHTICFAVELEKTVNFPRADIASMIQVHFVGPQEKWIDWRSRLRLEGGPLFVRAAVVLQWLRFLKTHHAHYARIRLPDVPESELQAMLNEQVASIIDGALVQGGGPAAAAAGSDIAAQDGETSGLPAVVAMDMDRELLGQTVAKEFRTAVLDAPPPAAAAAATAQGPAIPAENLREEADPINEFENNGFAISCAFPWLFFFRVDLLKSGPWPAAFSDALMRYHDGRFGREHQLVFHLFDQLQRHTVTRNVARLKSTNPAALQKLRDLKEQPNIHESIAAIEKGNVSTPGLKSLLASLCHLLRIGTKNAPFSKSDRDGCFTKMVALIRFHGPPGWFITFSPAASGNALAIKIAHFGDPGKQGTDPQTIEFSARAKIIFEDPAASAMYFEAVRDGVFEILFGVKRDRKATVEAASAESAVFGKATTYFSVVECQGRTLLHCHALLWTEVSPLTVQGALSSEEKLAEVCAHIDRCVTTALPEEFWKLSNALWDAKGHAEEVGLGNTPSRDSGARAEYLYHVLHGHHQIHRQHKPTCWKNSGKKRATTGAPKCRMASPYPAHEHETSALHLCYAVDEKGKQTESERPFVAGEPPICHHIGDCACEDVLDFDDKPEAIFIETKRLQRDMRVTGFNETLSIALASNTAIVPLGTMDQVVPIVLYLVKYLSKDKVENVHVLESLSSFMRNAENAERPPSAAANSFINAACGKKEVAVTMAAYALMRNFCGDCPESFVYVFVWKTMMACDIVIEAPPPKQDGDESDDEGLISEDDVEFVEPETERNDEEGGVIYRDEKGNVVVVSERQNYTCRGAALEGLCLVEYACLVQIEKNPAKEPKPRTGEAGEGREPSRRFPFSDPHPLAKGYSQRLRSKCFVPVLAGAPPPILPAAKVKTSAAAAARARWAQYWSTALLPWVGSPKAVTFEEMSAIVNAWKASSDDVLKQRARFALMSTHLMRTSKSRVRLVTWHRMRAADADPAYGHAVAPVDGAAPRDPKEADFALHLAQQLEKAISEGEKPESELHTVARFQALTLAKLSPPAAPAAAATRLGPRFSDKPERCAEIFTQVATFKPSARQGVSEEGAARRGASEDVVFDKSLTPEQLALQKDVVEMLRGSPGAIFVQGEPGTGKSYCIEKLVLTLERCYGGGCVKTFAPTGAAVANLLPGTETIHSGLGIDYSKPTSEPSAERLREMKNSWSGVRLVIVDEVSMVSPQLLVQINARMKKITGKNEDYGGLVVVFFGDFFQIPPVGSQSLLANALGDRKGVTEVQARRLWRQVRLKRFSVQKRAGGCEVQKARIEQMRRGAEPITRELLRGFKVLSADDLSDGAWRRARFLANSNAECAELNKTLCHRFALESGRPIIKWRKAGLSATGGKLTNAQLEKLYELCPDLTGVFVEGAPAMVTSNVCPSLGISNGSCVKFAGLCFDEGSKNDALKAIGEAAPGATVMLKVPPLYVLVAVEARPGISAPPCIGKNNQGNEIVVPLKGIDDKFKVNLPGFNREIKCNAPPVEIAFATTFHKCQGQTLDRVVLCAPKKKSAGITMEMFLVGATRVRMADHVRLMTLNSAAEDYEHLTKLKRNSLTEEWFAGEFLEDGTRKYAGPKRPRE